MKAGLTKLAPASLVLASLILFVAGCSDEQASTTTSTNSTLLIEPNLAVGPVRVGMTTAQVIGALGEPQRRTSNSLEYSRLGIAVMPGSDGIVSVVMCGDVTGINGPFVKIFNGRTKEGIGMRSTRAEVLKAYGQPTEDKKMFFVFKDFVGKTLLK